ncbi:DedA family protein [Brevibacillus nitrificans]|uniref:DedA family protein n=1 Tax=Brevibacillus nitrificans TaxID=651560 RepID=A0A3M8DGZ9_9BACL|nr:DedA family protein [Brevibacillus nitrificans]RNB86821.1 DedA family protein [Brevibacillus nitrificans]
MEVAVEHHLDLFLMKYGYVGIFFALALGVLGVPIPDEVLMTYAGYAVSRGVLQMPYTLLSAFLGASAGISISYAIGLKWGLPLLIKVGPYLHISPKRIESTQKLFARYGSYLLLVGYFLPGVRHITAYLAGIASMDFRRFAGFAYAGALIWSLTFLLLGRTLEREWFKVVVYIRHYGLTFLLIAAALGLATYLIVKWRQNIKAG